MISDEPVAVVTLVKDEWTALVRTVQSVNSQTIKCFHLIVSAEDPHVVERLIGGSSNSKRAIRRERRPGIYENMNFALKMLPGHRVLFLNAGDTFVSEDALAHLANAMSVECDWVFGGFIVTNFLGVKKSLVPTKFSIAQQLYARDYVCHQSVLARSDFLRQIGGFDETLAIAADWDLLCRASLVSRPESATKIIVEFARGGAAERSLKVGNRELYALRKKFREKGIPISKFESFLWFAYREFLIFARTVLFDPLQRWLVGKYDN